MSWRDRHPFDYGRWAYENREHHRRYSAYVEAHGLTCQECGGSGGSPGYSSIYALEPPEPCGYCEATGKVTRWMRGYWLRWKRAERKARELKAAAKKAKAA